MMNAEKSHCKSNLHLNLRPFCASTVKFAKKKKKKKKKKNGDENLIAEIHIDIFGHYFTTFLSDVVTLRLIAV